MDIKASGTYLPLDRRPRTRDYAAVWKRVPVDPCSFISPFHFPLNLAAHKIAPAMAVGCPIVLKPASLTPIGALIIGETLAETDLPEGAFSILPCRREGARLFVEDERLKLLSFTGSPAVGWDLKARAGKKKVTLEVGGIVVGDVPSWRADQMPYGGIEDSGLGREGIQFAMEDMNEIRLMVMRQLSYDS